MTTVGYGDVIPETTAGKCTEKFIIDNHVILFNLVIAVVCSLVGIFAFALPVPGIIQRFQLEQANYATLHDANISKTRRILRKLFMHPMRSSQMN